MEHMRSSTEELYIMKTSGKKKRRAILEQKEAGERLLTAFLGMYYKTHRTNTHT